MTRIAFLTLCVFTTVHTWGGQDAYVADKMSEGQFGVWSSAGKQKIEGGLRLDIVSIVLITNRPGVYDVVMYSLKNQTSDKYELIIIDALVDDGGTPLRRGAAERMARELGVNLAGVWKDKNKTKALESKYGLCNAYNSGAALSTGRVITILMDLTWLPPTFVQRTLDFYDHITPNPYATLAYLETHWDPPKTSLNHTALQDNSSLSIFKQTINRPPSDWMTWSRYNPNATNVLMPYPWVPKRDYIMLPWQIPWFDGGAWTTSWELWEVLNGCDEVLDLGNEIHNLNILERALMIGGECWLDGSVVVENIVHRELDETEDDLQKSDVQREYEEYFTETLYKRKRAHEGQTYWKGFLLPGITTGGYPIAAPNKLDMAEARLRRMTELRGSAAVQPMPSIRIIKPLMGEIIRTEKTQVSLRIRNFKPGRDGRFCLRNVAIGQEHLATTLCSRKFLLGSAPLELRAGSYFINMTAQLQDMDNHTLTCEMCQHSIVVEVDLKERDLLKEVADYQLDLYYRLAAYTDSYERYKAGWSEEGEIARLDTLYFLRRHNPPHLKPRAGTRLKEQDIETMQSAMDKGKKMPTSDSAENAELLDGIYKYEKTLYDLGTRWLSVRTGILEHMGGEDVALASESDDAATKRIRRPVVLKQLIEIIWNVRSEGWKWTLESGTDAPEHQDEVRLRRELDEITLEMIEFCRNTTAPHPPSVLRAWDAR